MHAVRLDLEPLESSSGASPRNHGTWAEALHDVQPQQRRLYQYKRDLIRKPHCLVPD